MAVVTRTDIEPGGPETDAGRHRDFPRADEPITSLNAQLARQEELQVKAVAGYGVLLRDTSAAACGDERAAGAMRHGKRPARLAGGGDR